MSVPAHARWALFVIALPALVAIWGGWVDIGEMTGFGPVKMLPGISDLTINTAISLPIGLEMYAAYSMYAWLTGHDLTVGTRRFAMWSAFGSLALGMTGQAASHVLRVNGVGTNEASLPVVIAVSAVPVLVLGTAVGLAHAMHKSRTGTRAPVQPDVLAPVPVVQPDVPAPVPVRLTPVRVPRTKPRTNKRQLGEELYRESLGTGTALSQRELAEKLGMKNRTLAAQIIKDVQGEGLNGHAVHTPV